MKTNKPPGRKRKYDWVSLFDKKKFTLEYGTDFKILSKSMLQQIKNAASALGVLIETEVILPDKAHKLKIKVRVLS